MTNAVIIDAVRTPGGRRNGMLKDWHPAELAAHVLKALQERNDLDRAGALQDHAHAFDRRGVRRQDLGHVQRAVGRGEPAAHHAEVERGERGRGGELRSAEPPEEQRGRGDDLAGRADAALEPAVSVEGVLDRRQLVVSGSDPLDRRDRQFVLG